MRSRITILSIAVLLSMASPSFSSEKAAYRYNKEGMEYMNAGKYQKAIESFKTAQNYMPSNETIVKNLMVAYNNYGFQLKQGGELYLAIEQFENALFYDERSPYTHYNLGQAYYLTQDITKAKQNLEAALRLKPDLEGARRLLSKIKREEQVETKFQTINTMHFIIGFSEFAPIDEVSYVKTYLEEAYGKIGIFLDYYPTQKTVVILYPEGAYDQVVKGKPQWSHGVFDGKIRLPASKYKYSTEDVVRIIYHEYAHVVLSGLTRGNCPNWFNEGIASKAEDYAHYRDREIIQKYIERFGLVPIPDIPGNLGSIRDRQKATLMYIESYLVIEYILKRAGNSGLQLILKALRNGYSLRNAIESLFKESLENFNRKWYRFVIDEFRIST